jgi:protein tyrosine phosphatase (PTP) superfamily phosphohydrolase (DUF442 family)
MKKNNMKDMKNIPTSNKEATEDEVRKMVEKLTNSELKWKIFGQCFQAQSDFLWILTEEKRKRIQAGTYDQKV